MGSARTQRDSCGFEAQIPNLERENCSPILLAVLPPARPQPWCIFCEVNDCHAMAPQISFVLWQILTPRIPRLGESPHLGVWHAHGRLIQVGEKGLGGMEAVASPSLPRLKPGALIP